ncbi:globin domain-containing protein [Mangrovicoccus sp. HB161399]|uniref:globin domain-containing protein n=1 Tax=Mangrovicoccus sp. HB161399 TaxID=2720392 RepID=UPI00155192D9|nr:globin domain-containing protein [Mangrovicoccus sp. HB161399]
MPCPCPDQTALLKDSFPDVFRAKARIGALAYQHLFAAAPETEQLFTGAFSAQHEMLVEELALILRVAETDEPLPKAARLGRYHASLGVEQAHFAAMREALLAAIGEVLGPQFTPAMQDAWARAFDRLATQMKAEMASALRAMPVPHRP